MIKAHIQKGMDGALEAKGSLLEILSDYANIGRAIYNQLKSAGCDEEAEAFRIGVKQLTGDPESPMWKPMPGIGIAIVEPEESDEEE